MADGPYLLRAENLSVGFGVGGRVLHALDGVTLDVKRGETVGLVGESGSGKSTMAMTLMRAIRPESGRIMFDGADLIALDDNALKPVRARLQMVFQDPYSSLDPRMKVRDIIAEPLRAHRRGTRAEIACRVGELIAAVGLPSDAADRLPQQFSGGQRQRIAIARALALEPDMLIADEPVSALDVSIQAQIINLLRDIQRRLGITYLVIAHDLALIHQISDRIAVMYLGRIVEEGPADELVARPAHPYTVSLLAATPVAFVGDKRESVVLRGEPPSAIDRPPGCAFHPRCPIARDICAMNRPELTETTGGRKVACHFPGELPSPVARIGGRGSAPAGTAGRERVGDNPASRA